jgi:RNA polymerase sigma factor (sigma-70 family)
MPDQPDPATVIAARGGDPAAIDRLVAGYLPLVYTIVGRALEGHADVDDVVQDVMLRVLRNLSELRDPEAFRSWLVAIAVRQVRERYRARRGAPDALVDADVRDPGADFTDLAITRLELSGQRRETAEATRWLDEDNRELLALWWLEASGELTRDEIVAAIGVTRQHAAVRIQRMKGQLETARVVVRALAATPPCTDLRLLTADWDGRPNGLWRKRIARHTRDCATCAPTWSGLVAAERLLAGMALVPPSLGLGGGPAAGGMSLGTHGAGTHGAGTHGAATHGAGTHGAATHGGHAAVGKIAAKTAFGAGRRILAAVLTTGAVAGGSAAVVVYRNSADQHVATAAAVSTRAPAPRLSVPSPAPSATSVSPPPKPARSRVRGAPKAPIPAATTSTKKGVSVWKFPGLAAALTDVGAGWYYNWAANNNDVPGPAGVEFVPMIWGKASVNDATIRQAKSEGTVLLGFNEPDLAGQANMTVEDALAAWPRLEASGMRLGSPAVAYGGDSAGGWLDRFMVGAKRQSLRVDFITLHWYGSDFGPAAVGQFLGYVDAVHRRYGKPIWVTEYGLINFGGSPKYPTGAQEAAFIRGSTHGMETRSFVERYAWFALPAVGNSMDYGLYQDGATPTAAGKAYKAAG